MDTTLGYAPFYDGTVAADYYRAMAHVERQLHLAETETPAPMCSGQLLALVDALNSGTLNAKQQELVQTLRTEILAISEVGH